MAHASSRIVVCGAGIAGVAAAYHLAVKHGCEHVTLIEEGNPLSLTSDKSTEAYRNWWPGPDASIIAYMNRSIDLMEELARETGNRIVMNRRGYAFASADPAKADWLIEVATQAQTNGGGPVRVHDHAASAYDPAPDAAFDAPLAGADILTDPSLIRCHYPYLATGTRVVAHARRAGWLSAQQLGQVMLEAAREAGVKLVRGTFCGADTAGGRLRAVEVEQGGERRRLEASHLVICAGPHLPRVAGGLGLDLPVYAERHFKISFPDTEGVMPRTAPMVIWIDPQQLPWSAEEREVLAADDSTSWLTDPFPAGVHGRPDGSGGGATVLALFNYESKPAEVIFPLPEHEHYAEITLRGMTTMMPGLATYVEKGIRPYVDGGYYLRTRENRPLIGPTAIEGVFVSAAFSGFGIMASCAGGDLVARHVVGAPLPDYAPAFLVTRYQNPAYQALLANWGDDGQL